MTNRSFLKIAIVGILAFLLGWFLHGIKKTSPEKEELRNALIDTLRGDPDTLKIKSVTDFSKMISGRFIMIKSNCAGFNFINKDTVLWINEIACNDPETLKIHWLDDATFMTRSTERVNTACPPKVEIYKVLLFDGKHLILNSVGTGWNDSKDETLEFNHE